MKECVFKPKIIGFQYNNSGLPDEYNVFTSGKDVDVK